MIPWFFAPVLVGSFIRDTGTIFYGAGFIRILCISIATYPLMFVIRAWFGVEYILWSSVIMDFVALIISVILFRKRFAETGEVER